MGEECHVGKDPRIKGWRGRYGWWEGGSLAEYVGVTEGRSWIERDWGGKEGGEGGEWAVSLPAPSYGGGCGGSQARDYNCLRCVCWPGEGKGVDWKTVYLLYVK